MKVNLQQPFQQATVRENAKRTTAPLILSVRYTNYVGWVPPIALAALAAIQISGVESENVRVFKLYN